MSEEEFTRLEGDPETYGERFVAEARRARESETSWLAAHNRAVKAFNDTNAEKDDWRRTALKAEADLAREKERADSLDRQLVLATAAIVTIGRERNALAERVKKLEKSVEFYKACNERRKASGNTDHPTETRKQLRDQRDALAARVGRYEKALREIAEHPTVTENCMGVYDIDVAKRIAARALAGTPAAEGVADKEGGA
jgi:chromosome segregation ATPase